MSAPGGPEGPGARGAGGLDLEPDVERIHRPLYREPRDPSEGREPAPWWVWVASVLAIFWGGFYLGQYGGTFGIATHRAFPGIERAVEREVRETAAVRAAEPVAAGRRVYERVCQTCHQPDGFGVPGAFPPLRGSSWVTGPETRMLRIVLHGLRGPVEVSGVTYDGVMPAWGSQLSDEEVAAVATFVRQWDPNDAPPVDPEAVARVRGATSGRGEPYTAAQLQEETAS